MKHLKIFTADNCPPCKNLKPLLEGIDPSISRAYFDRDKDSSVFKMHDIKSVPTLIYFKDDEPRKVLVGSITSSQLKEFLK